MWRRIGLIACACVLLAPGGAHAAFPGANGRIFFTAFAPAAAQPDVYSVKPDGSDVANLTDLPGGPGTGSDPSASGDGSRIAFTVGSDAGSEIWLMHGDGSQPTRLTDNSFRDEQPGISPDGARIAFVSARDPGLSDRDIWVMGADGSAQALLLDGPGAELFPEFSPSGEELVMASQVSGDFDIAYAPSAGGPFAAATPLSDAMPSDEITPSTRPDASRVAFSRGSPGDIIDAFFNGTDELPIAADPASDERSPAYSPDGTKIVYDSGDRLLVAASGGANPVALAIGDAADPGDPNWAPAGDVKPPETEITRAPKRRTRERTAKFRFRSSEHGSSFECRLDRRPFTACASPQRYKQLKARKHRFRVRAIDSAGNVDPSAAQAKFRVTP